MATDYEETPTFLGYSDEAVGVIAGGGIFGFGGIVLHEPTENEFHRISLNIEYETSEPKGFVFAYDDIATVTISGLLRWTNAYLYRAPKGRQDVSDTGPVRIEVFDKEQTRQYVEEQSKLFERLGVKFIC